MEQTPSGKLTQHYLVKKLPTSHGIRKFINVLQEPATCSYSQAGDLSPRL